MCKRNTVKIRKLDGSNFDDIAVQRAVNAIESIDGVLSARERKRLGQEVTIGYAHKRVSMFWDTDEVLRPYGLRRVDWVDPTEIDDPPLH